MKPLTIVLAGLLVLPGPACAQSYLDAWLTAEDFGRQLERSQQSAKNAESPPSAQDSRQAAIQAERRRLMLEHARKIIPEYHQRVTRDGRTDADAWLKKVTDEYDRQDREAIRAKFGE